jgi:hypothetical protein
MTIKFELGMSSATAIQLYPEYDYKDSEKLIESRHRTLGGRQYNYKWSDYDNFEFSLNFVSEANASIINSWWNVRADLLYFVTSGSNTDVYSVMLMNNEKPLSGYNKPYDTYRKGKIILQTY